MLSEMLKKWSEGSQRAPPTCCWTPFFWGAVPPQVSTMGGLDSSPDGLSEEEKAKVCFDVCDRLCILILDPGPVPLAAVSERLVWSDGGPAAGVGGRALCGSLPEFSEERSSEAWEDAAPSSLG